LMMDRLWRFIWRAHPPWICSVARSRRGSLLGLALIFMRSCVWRRHALPAFTIYLAARGRGRAIILFATKDTRVHPKQLCMCWDRADQLQHVSASASPLPLRSAITNLDHPSALTMAGLIVVSLVGRRQLALGGTASGTKATGRPLSLL
jgi:hypothetical protein